MELTTILKFGRTRIASNLVRLSSGVRSPCLLKYFFKATLSVPERFLEGGGGYTRALIPFGGGARLCLGETVAKMELFLFTAYLLRDFCFVLPDSEAALPDLRGVASVVLKVKSFTVIARPRTGP